MEASESGHVVSARSTVGQFMRVRTRCQLGQNADAQSIVWQHHLSIPGPADNCHITIRKPGVPITKRAVVASCCAAKFCLVQPRDDASCGRAGLRFEDSGVSLIISATKLLKESINGGEDRAVSSKASSFLTGVGDAISLVIASKKMACSRSKGTAL